MGTADEAELVPHWVCALGGTTSAWSALDECLVRSEAVIMGTADEAELVPPWVCAWGGTTSAWSALD